VNRSLILCDRVMYGALLALIFVLPYSLALIQICLATIILAWIVKCCLSAQGSHRFQGFNLAASGMGWSLLAIALLIVLTIPFSHYPALSIKKFFSRFVQQIFLMYVVTEIVHSRKRVYGVLTALLLTLFFVSLDVMFQYAWGTSLIYHTTMLFSRVTGPMNHPNDLGTLLATVLPVVLILGIIFRKWKSSPYGVAIAVLFLFLAFALGLTSSRGAWVAFAVSMISMGVYLKKYKLVVLTIVILVVFFWAFGMHCLSTRVDVYNAPKTQGAVINPSFNNPFGLPPGYNAFKLLSNSDGRDFYWETAVDVIKRYPWFGCGYSAYMRTLSDLRVGHEEYPHNTILHITVELGLVGLALYGWFFSALFLELKKVLRAISRERDLFLIGCGLSSGILAWMIHSLMDTAWASLQLSILWWLFIGIVLSLGFIPREMKEKG